MLKKLILLSALLGLAGCANIPDEMQVADGTPLAAYPMVVAHPKENLGRTARWGGVIAKVTNLSDKTLLEVVLQNLKPSTRPHRSDSSPGRFRVYVNGFLDPMIYQPGRAITVLGTVLPSEKGMVGKHAYIYPTLQANKLHMWKDIQRVDVTTISVWPDPFYYGWRGYYGWGTPFYNQRVIIRSTTNSPSASPMARPPVIQRPNVQRMSRPSTPTSGNRQRQIK